MTKIVDLSGSLFNGMWSYNVLPGLPVEIPEYHCRQVSSVSDTGFESFRLTLSSVTGTYIETGAHLIEGAPLLAQLLPPDDFVRQAVVCHVPAKQPRQLVRKEELEKACPPVHEGDALLIECGWSSQWRSPNYVTDGPGFHPDCLDWLLEKPISLLGVDIPCVQPPWAGPEIPYRGNILLPIFQKGVLLLAPLVNLGSIRVDRGELWTMPLNAEGVSGAPCRAAFREP
jgi:arylformamidase